MPSKPGFRLGIYMCKDLEIVDFAAPYGVFSVARRLDPELDAFFVAESLRPIQAQAGFTIMPNYAFADGPDMDAFLIPGGFGTRQELNNGRLHAFIGALPDKTLLVSVCTGSWIYGRMGLLDGRMATNRKEPDRLESSNMGKVPIDRLAEIAPACPHQPRTSGGQRPHHYRRRHRVGHGGRLPPAPPRGLRGGVPHRGGPHHGIRSGL
jgi:putative intracellular protease/amidase